MPGCWLIYFPSIIPYWLPLPSMPGLQHVLVTEKRVKPSILLETDTPLKINMEHKYGGLEDHFPFFSWVICRFRVHLTGVILDTSTFTNGKASYLIESRPWSCSGGSWVCQCWRAFVACSACWLRKSASPSTLLKAARVCGGEMVIRYIRVLIDAALKWSNNVYCIWL